MGILVIISFVLGIAALSTLALFLLTWWVAGAIIPTLLVDPTNFWAWLGVLLVLSIVTTSGSSLKK